VLIGREGELGLIDGLLERVGAGNPQVVCIEGEPGIGKSALLDELTGAAAHRGWHVVASRCDELGQGLPFGPLVDAPGGFAEDIRALRSSLWGESGGSRSSLLETGPEARSVVIDAIAEAVEKRCLAGPLVVCIDDLHWADNATLLALLAAFRRCTDLPFGLGIACRPHPRGPELTAFLDALPATRAELPPLTPDEVARLVAVHAGAPPAADLAEATARCGGNPLLLVETVSQLAEDRAIEVVDGHATTSAATGGTVKLTLRDAVRSRMARVDGEIRAVAAVGALMGSRFTVADLAAVTGRSLTDLLPLLEELVVARLLVDDGTSLSFRHDLVREAVASALPASVRAELHQAIADGLRASGAAAPRVAEHVALAAPYGSSDAIDVLRTAAGEVTAQDPIAAQRLLHRALELCPPTDAVYDQVLAELVDAMAWSGRTAEAEAIAAKALQRLLRPGVEEQLRSALGRALLLLGRPKDAITHEERVIELREQRDLPTAWAQAECAMCRLFGLDMDGALAGARAAVDIGRAENDLMAQILGLSVQVFAHNAHGDSATAAALGTQAVELADESPRGVGHRLHPYLFRGIALQTLGQHDAAAASFRQGRALGEALGASWALPIYHFATALAHWDRGEWDDLLAEVDAGIGLAEEEGSTIGQVWALAVAARVHLHRGDLDRARAFLDRGDAVLASAGLQYGIDWLVLSRALLLEAEEQPDEACALLRAAWEIAAGMQARAAIMIFGPELTRLAVVAGDDDLARMVLGSLAEVAQSHPSDLVVAGRVARSSGTLDRDTHALTRAADTFRQLGHVFEAATVDVEIGRLLASSGDPSSAVPALERALAVFDDIGAAREAQAARAALAASQPGRRTTGRRVRPVEGWGALTPTESEVVEEVCAGRSNGEVAVRLGVSRRTVEAHLRSIYTKLRVPTRLALAVAYRASSAHGGERA
jgi:ATP/maltotriose-dependent transcriptional regulator MalT